MRRKTAALACAAAATLVLARPATAATPSTVAGPPAPQTSTTSAPTAPYADPLRALGASSPACRGALSPRARSNCRRTGAAEHAYPLSSYGFDVQVGFSVTHLERSFLGALQNLAALLWMALVYLLKATLLLLEWAFSIDLLGTAMPGVRNALTVLHTRVIGEPWMLTAISVAGLWGIWRGLVQRQATGAMAGLAATVLLMAGGLVILARPEQTVGYASHLANDAALGILSATNGHGTNAPTQSLADATIGVFDQIVRDPWCALEFGSVTYCDERPAADRRVTNADVWLHYPAGSDERTALFHLLKGEPQGGDHGLVHDVTSPALGVIGLGGDDPSVPDEVAKLVRKEPERAALQDSGGTVPRFALLTLIAAGMTGAIALLAYLGIRLLLASVLALLLLLFAPAVMLAPAFGETGRATFIAWFKRLAGALAAKLIYALLLSVVLVAAAMLRRLEIGWFGTWLLQIAFWWGVLLKRHELIGVTAAGQHQTGGGLSQTLSHAYYGAALTRSARSVVQRAAHRPAVAVAAARRNVTDHRTAQRQAVAELAGEQLDAHGTTVLQSQQQSAQRALVERRAVERELRALDRRLARYDEKHATTRAQWLPAPEPTEDQRALLAHRQRLLDRLSSPELQGAAPILAHAQRNRAQGHGEIAPRDLAAWRTQRTSDLAARIPVDHERNLTAAGIDPADYRAGDEAQRADMLATVERHIERERQLAAIQQLPPTRPPRELNIDAEAVRARRKQRLEDLRAERRRRQERRNVIHR